MKCTVSVFTILVILTFIIPTEIGCSCSKNLNDIISLMSQDPDFPRNPCYIEWKADQDKKSSELWRQREELENSIARNNEIESKNREIERENWQNSFRRTTVTSEEKKGLSAGAVFALVIVCILGFICACIAKAIKQNDDDSTVIPTANALPTNQSTVILTTAGLATSAFGDQRTLNLSSATSANTNLTAYSVDARSSPSIILITTPRQEDTNVPLLPRGPINRQNSLPSYEDAVKMPSAPLME